MGIQGLLPFLKDATEAINVRKYKGHAVAVDTYCWIHRGAVACGLQLAKGEKCDQYVRYCLRYVNMLLSLDIKPVLVFDGQNLPSKKSVEDSRRKRREMFSQKGKQLLREGKTSEARDAFVKCINVTSEMALDVMKAVRSLGVDCIVAPYEADAQLAFLEKYGYVQAIITEDSDLLAFGCKRVIFKMDHAGNAIEINQARLNQAVKMGTHFSVEKFRHMCILAGCDYLPSLPGVGLGKARKFLHTVSNLDIQQFLKRLPLQLKLKSSVPQEYIDGFVRANNTFLYQLAFDPRKKKLMPLNPYPPELEREKMDYAGSYMDSELSFELALGNVEVYTMKRIFSFKPVQDKTYHKGTTPPHKLSIWHQDYQPAPPLQSDDPCRVTRQPTKGQEVSIPSQGMVKNKPVSKKRPREDNNTGDTATSDAALASIYGGSPKAKVLKLEEPETIPETPSPDNNMEKKTVPARPAPRNIFAIRNNQRMGSDTRKDLLNSDVTVSSRFFQTQSMLSSKEMGKSENSKENEMPINEETNHIYTPKNQDDSSSTQSDLEEDAPVVNDSIRNHQRKVRGTTGRLCDKNIDRTSVLDSLQKFRHSDDEHAQIKQEFELKQKMKSPPSSSRSKKRQQRRGVFSWSNKSPSTNKTQKTWTDSIKGLSAFHRSTNKFQLPRSTSSRSSLSESCSQASQEQGSPGDVDSSQEVQDSIKNDIINSQSSLTPSVGSFSQLSIDSVDKDGPTFSQVLERDGLSFSPLSKNDSQRKISLSPGEDQKSGASSGDEALCNILVDIAQEGEAVKKMETDAGCSKQEEFDTYKSSLEDEEETAHVADVSKSYSNKTKLFSTNSSNVAPALPSLCTQAGTKCCQRLSQIYFSDSDNEKSILPSARRHQPDEKITSQRTSHTSFRDSSSDENSPPEASRRYRGDEKITSSYFKKSKAVVGSPFKRSIGELSLNFQEQRSQGGRGSSQEDQGSSKNDTSDSSDENRPPETRDEKITSCYFKKSKDVGYNPVKRSNDTVRSLGSCKVPGLSKKQKRKPSTNQQPTLMAFMTKKPPAGSSKKEPFSPSKLEALQNITPEADAVYVKDKATTVRKNIFK